MKSGVLPVDAFTSGPPGSECTWSQSPVCLIRVNKSLWVRWKRWSCLLLMTRKWSLLPLLHQLHANCNFTYAGAVFILCSVLYLYPGMYCSRWGKAKCHTNTTTASGSASLLHTLAWHRVVYFGTLHQVKGFKVRCELSLREGLTLTRTCTTPIPTPTPTSLVCGSRHLGLASAVCCGLECIFLAVLRVNCCNQPLL